jgi:hypothetical protein
MDVERPAPRQVIGEQLAHQLAEHGGDTENGTQGALVLAALAQRDDVGDHGGHSSSTSPASSLWPGGVELEVDELDDAVRSKLTDNRDRAQQDAADHQDPIVVSARYKPGKVVPTGGEPGEDRHKFVELEVRS